MCVCVGGGGGPCLRHCIYWTFHVSLWSQTGIARVLEADPAGRARGFRGFFPGGGGGG